jgi:hypothetical protein
MARQSIELQRDWTAVQSVRAVTNQSVRPIVLHVVQTNEQKELKGGVTVRFAAGSPPLDIHLCAPAHQVGVPDVALVDIER